MLRKFLFASLAATVLAMLAVPATWAAENLPEVRFQKGRFEPMSLSVPANQPVQIKVVNRGDSAIEFESFELNRERVVQPGQTITVYLRPLSAGTYHFFDDFHHDAGQGTLEAK